MSINHTSKPTDAAIVLHINGQKSRRQDNKVTNLATNPEQRHFPCLGFDGVDDFVSLPDPGILNTTNWTIYSKFSVSDVTEYRCVYGIGSHTSDTPCLYIRVDSSRKVRVSIKNDSNSLKSFTSTTAITLNEIHEIAVTYDGTTISLYIDGVYNNSLTVIYGTVTTTRAAIGEVPRLATLYPFMGNIYSTRVFSETLSPDEVLADHLGQSIDSAGLIGQWLFSEGTGSIAIDSSGEGNNGTIYGATWQDGKSNGTLIGGVSYKNAPDGKSVLNFDGTDDYVRHQATDNYSTNLSVFIWANGPFQSYLIGRYDTGLSDRGWIIGTDQANEKRMRVLLSSTGAYGSTTSKDYLTTAEVFDDNWHLYGFSWASGVLRLFVDGREQAVTKTYNAVFTSIYKVKSDIIVGARIISNVPSGFYTGQVGEYYVYKRTVSPSEGSILYNDTRKFYGR